MLKPTNMKSIRPQTINKDYCNNTPYVPYALLGPLL